MDSCVTAAIAAEQHELAFLHVTYGQRTATRERKAFGDSADFYHVQHRLVTDISHLRVIGGSALTDEHIPVPTTSGRGSWVVDRGSSHESRITNHESRTPPVPITYVPFRNTHLLAIAVSWAEVIRAKHVFVGAVAEDSSGYPDCRPEYYQVFNQLIEVGTKPETHIKVITPVIDLRKSAIIQKGLALGAPLHLTWSCYQAEDRACGQCESCALRIRAFQQAAVIDPIPYAISIEWGAVAHEGMVSECT